MTQREGMAEVLDEEREGSGARGRANSAFDRLARVAGAAPEVVLAYLFGSRARGTGALASDYDVGVLFQGGRSVSTAVVADLQHRLVVALGGDRVDLVTLNAASPEIAFAVVSEGQVLVCRDVAARVEYEARVLAVWGDYGPVLRKQRDDLLRGAEYGTRVRRYRAALGRVVGSLGEASRARGAPPRGV